jgi:glycosyltransferase involved in cell wall biosynthesis
MNERPADDPENPPLRILYDHAIFARQRYGGISRYFAEIIPRIARDSRARVLMFMGLHINKYGLEQHRAQFERFFGMRRFIEGKTYKLSFGLNAALFKRFAKRQSPIDIVHETAYLQLPVPGARRVVTLHDLVPERMPELKLGNEELFRRKRQAVLEADGVICISERTKQDMLELYGQPRGKVGVIYHANSLNEAADPQPPLPFPYILFVGGRGSYKNFALLLEAYARSSSVRDAVHLVCFGGASFGVDELERASKLGVGESVHHLAGSDRLLINLYAHARVFVYPSRYEGFGIPLLEAMHYGCPVLASDASCFREIAGDAALYFDPDSPDDLSSKLQRVFDDASLREQLICSGKRREAEFSWERCTRETIEVYRSVCGRS